MSGITNLPTIIVIPCLNEQDTLVHACTSLEFGLGKQIGRLDRFLFIIDNGSTDSTLDIAKEIQYSSLKGTVFIGYELERGYIPPRHRGNLLARELASSNGWNAQEVLIVQADADTVYSAGYLDAMRSATDVQGLGVLIESCSEYPPDFVMTYPQYLEVCNIADQPFAEWYNDNYYDVVVDDKACGYRLQDYFDWGGHRREYDPNGEEIHAETTRLYMRAMAAGTRRFRVELAVAYHSVRKILENPLLEFATAGLPRAESWRTRWQQSHSIVNTIAEICANPEHPEVRRAINTRRRHVIALFGVLPLYIARTINEDSIPKSRVLIEKLLLGLPKRDKTTLSSHPGVLLTDVLYELDKYNDAVLDAIVKQIAVEGIEWPKN